MSGIVGVARGAWRVERVRIWHVTVLRGMDNLRPTRQHTDEEIASLIRASGVTTVVVLILG